MYVPVGVMLALLPVVATGALGAATWLVSKITRHAELIATAATKLDAHEQLDGVRFADAGRRLDRLEAWRDGYKAGAASSSTS